MVLLEGGSQAHAAGLPRQRRAEGLQQRPSNRRVDGVSEIETSFPPTAALASPVPPSS